MTSNSPAPALRVSGLRKAYGDVVAVDGLDLTVASGECFGLLGPNGAGKTTTIEICEGLTEPDAGEVEVLGRRWDRDERALRERLGIQLQETQLAEKLTVEETVRLFRSFYSRGRRVDDVIDIVQLGEKRRARVGKLSGGQKQRLALACAIVGDPELLFLDEPTTGFDPGARRSAWDMIKGLAGMGKTIFLTTHFMDEAQYLADRVAIIAGGRIIAQGPPEALSGRNAGATIIRFKLADGAALPAPVRATAREAGDFLEFSTANPIHFLHELTGWALAHKVVLENLEVTRPSLEDVYLELTGAEPVEAETEEVS